MNLASFQRQLDVNGEIDSDVAVCPHCFHEYEDSWEYQMCDGETSTKTCEACDKPFNVTMTIKVTYTTFKGEQV